MSGNAVDLAILLSLKCSVDVLFPNILANERSHLVAASRAVLSSSKKSIPKILKAPADRNLEKEIRKKIFQKTGATTQKNIGRYMSRLEKGFSHSFECDYLANVISEAGKAVENLSEYDFCKDEIIDLVVQLENSRTGSGQYVASIGDWLSSIDPSDSWDEGVMELHDHEYDCPYIVTLARQLDSIHRKIDFLYDWKRFLQPADYENIRTLLIDYTRMPHTQEFILPY